MIETRFSSTDGDVVTHATWHDDDDDRLTGENRSDGTTSTKDYYTLDLVGNRLKKASDSDGDNAVDQTTLYVYNDRDELTSSGLDSEPDGTIDTATKTTNGYDADGNQSTVTTGGVTKYYQWDLRNRMTGISTGNATFGEVGDIGYTYDSDGVRISESSKTSSYTRTTYYLNDPQNRTGTPRRSKIKLAPTIRSGDKSARYPCRLSSEPVNSFCPSTGNPGNLPKQRTFRRGFTSGSFPFLNAKSPLHAGNRRFALSHHF